MGKHGSLIVFGKEKSKMRKWRIYALIGLAVLGTMACGGKKNTADEVKEMNTKETNTKEQPADGADASREIGRASCRERVSWYV